MADPHHETMPSLRIPFYAVQLKGRRCLQMPPEWHDLRYTPARAGHILQEHLDMPAEEHLLSLWLNRHEEIVAGLWLASPVHTWQPDDARDVFKTAKPPEVTSLVLVHNHPTGTTRPTDADLSLTWRVIAWGQALGVTLADHVIVSNHGASVFSFLQHGWPCVRRSVIAFMAAAALIWLTPNGLDVQEGLIAEDPPSVSQGVEWVNAGDHGDSAQTGE